MKPLVSIIIPVFNVEKYIKECFDSIRKQNMMNDVEIICIDDGSTDKSGIICDEYAKLDKNFKVIHQKNKGISATRNLGIKISQGKYIAWIDPDDYISDNWWSSIKKLLKKDRKIDVIFFDYVVMEKEKYINKRFSNKSKCIDKKIFLYELAANQKIQGQLWQKVFKRELIENLMFPENVSFLEDYAMLPKFTINAQKIYYLSEFLYIHRTRKKSLTTDVSMEKIYISYLIVKKI